MSLKCSVLGHRYGQTEVEREREEDGSEVIITVREISRCERCGNERIVSENKEVTTLETAAEIVADDLENEQPPSESSADTPSRTEPASGQPQASADESGQPTVDVSEAEEHLETPGVGGATGDKATDDVIEAGEDDAVILDDEEDEDEREPGEWPEEAETDERAAEESESWPAEDETDSSEKPGQTQAGEWPEETQRDTNDEHREPGEWPQEPEPDDDGSNWESLTKPEPRPLDEPAVEPTKSAVSVPEGMFRCSNCEYSTPVEESPLRAGDFCPECRIGSLEHHTE